MQAGTMTGNNNSKLREKETKILILGSYNSGKTTTLENICHNKAKVEYNGTTISLDYGNTQVNGKKVHIFASPGQERFRFMREVLSRGMDGAIVVVDNSQGATPLDLEIMETLHRGKVPYVVFANKQDLNPAQLDFNGLDPHIVPTTAQEGKGVQEGLNLLLDMVKEGS
ncbi:MAG: GTP-binding protein [Methanobacteriaceae archaeon]|nr:GTP-binding protein [Methanobacteriaceae archaeon]